MKKKWMLLIMIKILNKTKKKSKNEIDYKKLGYNFGKNLFLTALICQKRERLKYLD